MTRYKMPEGSPPRMRGKGPYNSILQVDTRITPAYAGKSARPLGAPLHPADHPRVCGEKNGYPRPWRKHKGSPPRMRGKATRCRCPARPARITPAYAGKRVGFPGLIGGARDHPRVCGEKSSGNLSRVLGQGSPPRMRGKVSPVVRVRCFTGITPAYAGKSAPAGNRQGVRRDHPRVCGEKKI